MDAGDFSQGSTSVNVSESATAVELMNMAGYDVATTGNHGFDFGYANLKTLMESADFPSWPPMPSPPKVTWPWMATTSPSSWAT